MKTKEIYEEIKQQEEEEYNNYQTSKAFMTYRYEEDNSICFQNNLFLGLNKRQWLAFTAAWLGWGLDVFDALLFNYVAPNCIPTLLQLPIGSEDAHAATLFWTGLISSILLIGWGIGGIAFGYFADKYGRKLTMQLTIFLFAIATACCAFSLNIYMLILFRFLSALGIGGEWAAGALLVAESLPNSSRVIAGASLYSAAPFGLIFAAAVNYLIAAIFMPNSPHLSWRVVFLFGIIPAIVASLVRFFVDEPEKWVNSTNRLNADNQKMIDEIDWMDRKSKMLEDDSSDLSALSPLKYSKLGNYSSLDDHNVRKKSVFSDQYRDDYDDDDHYNYYDLNNNNNDNNNKENNNNIGGLFKKEQIRQTMSGVTTAGIVTVVWWSVNSFTAIIAVGFARRYAAAHSLSPLPLLELWKFIAIFCFNFGGLCGTFGTIFFAKFGRKFVFAFYFFGASFFLLFTFFFAFRVAFAPFALFLYFPIGFFVFGIFGVFPFYLPELFPTSLRGLGSGFSYNVGRFIAAGGPLLVGYIASTGNDSYQSAIQVMIYVGFIPLIGVIISPFLYETINRDLLD